LESKVEQQDHEIDELKEYIYSVQNENQALKEEVDDLRAKFNQLSLSYQSLSNSTFINNHANMDSFNSSLSELTSVPSSRGSSPILTDKDRLGQNCGRESRLAAFRTSTFDKSKHEADSNLSFLQRSMDVCFPV
jgi:predicted nuclease with TOPRIM domain